MSDAVAIEEKARFEVLQGDCLEVMRGMADNTVDAVVTDPPYFKVKNEAWDRQWDNPGTFLEWIGLLCAEWHRLLRPNGSLYCFASPQMSARVECKIGERFNVLNSITWAKESGRWKLSCKEDLRGYFPCSERIIFAEHYGADNIAKGESGYGAKCDQLRGFVFEPLRAYLAGEMERSGYSLVSVNKAWQSWKGGNGGMSSHWFTPSQWVLPTAANYAWLRALFNTTGGDFLRREYEDLRRLFAVSSDVPYTDVWTFPTVSHYTGKHPCEKPTALMRHIIQSSTRPGAVVLDPFFGSGSTGIACMELGRELIGIEQDELWVRRARARLDHAANAGKQGDLI